MIDEPLRWAGQFRLVSKATNYALWEHVDRGREFEVEVKKADRGRGWFARVTFPDGRERVLIDDVHFGTAVDQAHEWMTNYGKGKGRRGFPL